jgi:CRISPR-associated exonuclease Cas4
MQEKLSKNRKFTKLNIEYEDVIMDKYFEDEKIGIAGKIDLALICKDEIIPIEFKDVETKKPTYSHILQLYGYGYLLSKNYNLDFKQAFIIYQNNIKLHHINITSKIKNDFFDTVDKIKQILDDDILPNSSANETKCSQCEYINFCDDRI